MASLYLTPSHVDLWWRARGARMRPMKTAWFAVKYLVLLLAARVHPSLPDPPELVLRNEAGQYCCTHTPPSG